uniref:Uncharacterized protein n=1 Tax=Anguilla anguilla TaxID=7936 RepID=A0A0E9UC11_ANGAN
MIVKYPIILNIVLGSLLSNLIIYALSSGCLVTEQSHKESSLSRTKKKPWIQ